METTGNYNLDCRIFDVMNTAANGTNSVSLSFSQAYTIVLRNDELREEGWSESQSNRRRKQSEIDLCWCQREEQLYG